MTIALIAAGFLIMAYSTFFGYQLKSRASGGLIGTRLTQLLAMIAAFALSYLVVGALTFGRPADSSMLILSVILLLGAVFVILVLNLVRDVLGTLE
ncbi:MULTISPECIES: hypothetical protein [Deinococcus]|uniref:Uncharacterized protein n=1 Tax=Deinococcus knuensis TaxID=1837380 RepID=A0ABQ2SF09_9DEIO|nr:MULTISPECIES: hypothetical protein [Deinococcus]MBX8464965.1 hypothetical protein [Deinococcus sp. RIT780]MCD0157243.1 hypothetical protein [Deinococcus sp. 6GRE01]MCD0161623.1 hypothetical protein [Deinococcus sp. 6YEL10]MCD0167500.1 hypothetical protein [Deinococcus sp. 12RED42]MCD0177811.1 hypothetical protein [Deinococcus sp. 14RED07]